MIDILRDLEASIRAMGARVETLESKLVETEREREHARGVAWRFWVGDATDLDEDAVADWGGSGDLPRIRIEDPIVEPVTEVGLGALIDEAIQAELDALDDLEILEAVPLPRTGT